ncbi:MAG: amidohydrolase family protein [Thermodesulfobacteriota bacterium]|nr:amidohydrolase family protein [Thermodesulfobacteriota bacterium]
MVFMAQKAAFQLAFHVSDVYILQASLKAIESILPEMPKYDLRHRLEHCAVCPPDLLPHLKKNNPIIVSQPSFLYYTGQRYFNGISPSQLKWVFPFESYCKNNIQIAFGSDSPVVPSNPLTGIYAAVTSGVENGQVLCGDESISVIDALGMYILCGAYASFEEGIKGSVSKGKLADLVVLNNDPTQIAPEEMMDLKVIQTIMDGRVMWDSI